MWIKEICKYENISFSKCGSCAFFSGLWVGNHWEIGVMWLQEAFQGWDDIIGKERTNFDHSLGRKNLSITRVESTSETDHVYI